MLCCVLSVVRCFVCVLHYLLITIRVFVVCALYDFDGSCLSCVDCCLTFVVRWLLFVCVVCCLMCVV